MVAEGGVVTLTDVDTVRDMAATASELYVATDRGVLVYGPPGGGPPPPPGGFGAPY